MLQSGLIQAHTNLESESFKRLEEFVWSQKEGHVTDAFLIYKSGKLIYEKYGNGYTAQKPHMLWSLTKSLTSTIVGHAIFKGQLSFDELASDYFVELRKPLAEEITVEDLLTMTSGLKFYEEHPFNIILSDSIYAYYSRKSYKNVAASMAKREMKDRPGEKFNYNVGQAHLLMGVLKRSFNSQKEYEDFVFKEVLDRLGMTTTVFEQDLDGNFLGGSGAFATAIEYLALGKLILNNGQVDGEEFLPAWWMEKATGQSPQALLKAQNEEDEMRLNRESYGFYWWLNKKLPMNDERPYPTAPEDMVQALGFRGQTMAVFPSHDMIVLRFGSDSRKETINRKKLYKLLFKAVE